MIAAGGPGVGSTFAWVRHKSNFAWVLPPGRLGWDGMVYEGGDEGRDSSSWAVVKVRLWADLARRT